MFTEQPTMNSLFSQLGLGSSDEEIAEQTIHCGLLSKHNASLGY